ncbi:hypothetical protein PG984_001550 [Apiospora sp. TS-2023a]
MSKPERADALIRAWGNPRNIRSIHVNPDNTCQNDTCQICERACSAEDRPRHLQGAILHKSLLLVLEGCVFVDRNAPVPHHERRQPELDITVYPDPVFVHKSEGPIVEKGSSHGEGCSSKSLEQDSAEANI